MGRHGGSGAHHLTQHVARSPAADSLGSSGIEIVPADASSAAGRAARELRLDTQVSRRFKGPRGREIEVLVPGSHLKPVDRGNTARP